MGYQVLTEQRGERTIYTLFDDHTGASASILPSFGFNLFELKLPAAGQPRSMIVTSPGWVENPTGAAGNGFPILFPFPNRIKDGKYSFAGKAYELERNLGPNAIHGFAVDAPWDVVDHGTDSHGAYILGKYTLSNHSRAKAKGWPTDAVLELKYTLAERTLSLDATVCNPTDFELPYGLGFHPYFRLPFGPGGSLEQTRVILPASQYWVLDEFIPTGERRAVSRQLDFRRGRPMANLKADDVLTGLARDETGHATCRLIDENLKAELRMAVDSHYREIVVYTPPGKPDVVSVEPYTQTTDAINLHARGVDGGLRLLEPGGCETMHLRLETVDD